jgi:hypothetical protein
MRDKIRMNKRVQALPLCTGPSEAVVWDMFIGLNFAMCFYHDINPFILIRNAGNLVIGSYRSPNKCKKI